MSKLKWLKFLIAFLVPVAGVMVCNNALDNDSWYVLAEGREIVTHGIYYEDQLSMHEGLEVTVQNYGFAVIFYWIYSVFGGVGIYIAMLILNLGLCYLLYKVCMLLSNKNVNLSLFLMILTDLLLAYCFIVTRAQVVDYVILISVIFLMELYIRKGKVKLLWAIPVLSLIQINLHASTWPMLLAVMVIYIIDGVKQPRLHYEGYKIKPLIITGVGVILAGFLNPYGVKMMTLMLTSYGIPEANDFVNELRPFSMGNNFYILLYAVIVIVMLLYIFGKNKNIRLRYLLMTFGFLALGLNTVKGMSQLILVLLFPMAEVYGDVRIEKWRGRKLWRVAGFWVGVLAVMTVISYTIMMLPDVNTRGPSEIMIRAMDRLDEKVGDFDKNNLKVYADYDEGGYVEYRGYKAYIDPRMEVFLKANNGKEDVFLEYYNLRNNSGEKEQKEFLEKYDFDYLMLREYDTLYDTVDTSRYELIFEDDNGEDNGARVYKKIEEVEGGIKI